MANPKNLIVERYDPGIHGTINDEPSLTQQQYAEETDINFIMKRYTTTGLLPLGTTDTGTYGDFSEVTDYRAALDIIQRAQDQFAELEAHVRARFLNDPAQLLAFIQDPANYEEARKLGFLKAEPPPPPPPPDNPVEGQK